ncbi:histone deacetylase family protein [Aestuariivirga sp.]|uniref:histone deacetylase family protein n=1 Tax=Aestuariivirga sp. TaxID=2650926 RepID=UPI0039E560B0
MQIIFSEDHRLHFPQGEIFGGEFVTPFERPSRMEYILRELKARKFTDIKPPSALDMGPVRKIHDADYLTFLETGWAEWTAAGYRGEMLAAGVPNRSLRQKCPKSIDGKVGYYTHSVETCITAGTWGAAKASAAVAQTAQKLVSGGAPHAFALCRPPGHHAHDDLFGGYCFLNNAAIAAEGFRASGARKVAILDVDVHHGNGTQDIFYQRNDVLFISLHGAPEYTYPYFLGYADEKGEGPGEGFNINYPIPPGGAYDVWGAALEDACTKIAAYKPDVLIVSLGVDTFKLDPISPLKLEHEDFTTYGGRIARLKLPTLIVMECGYAVEAIGINTVNVLEGFLNA